MAELVYTGSGNPLPRPPNVFPPTNEHHSPQLYVNHQEADVDVGQQPPVNYDDIADQLLQQLQLQHPLLQNLTPNKVNADIEPVAHRRASSTEKHVPSPFKTPPRAQSAPRKTAKSYCSDDELRPARGPVILRDLEPAKMGFPPKHPTQFLRKNGGGDLRKRVEQTTYLKHHPVDREAPFVPGNGSIVKRTRPLSAPTLPSPSSKPGCSMLRFLYDNTTLDFVCIRSVGNGRKLAWGTPGQGGLMSWGDDLSEINVGRWLPIFIDGIRETQDPYHFIASKGAPALMSEAGPLLHQCAADLALALKGLMDTREPQAVAEALDLMNLGLATDPKVAAAWLPYLWRWAPVLGLFFDKAVVVADGPPRFTKTLRLDLKVSEFLAGLQAKGGPQALPTLRKYCPFYTPLPKVSNPGPKDFKPYLLL